MASPSPGVGVGVGGSGSSCEIETAVGASFSSVTESVKLMAASKPASS